VVETLKKEGIECRPLVCGSIGEQPYWIERYGKQILPNATKVHNDGLYVPNNQDMSVDEIRHVARVLNHHL
jgi:CDP-6-deoxy-D-xylo-4-hexulose-3-dehydrase